MADAVYRGGPDTERLYVKDADFQLSDGRRCVVARSAMPKASLGMEDVIARSIARYGLVALYCRPHHKILDVPCGSGYASPFLLPFGIQYVGLDADLPTVEYAQHVYGNNQATFRFGDMTCPDFGTAEFNVVACIEGLEHIEQQCQAPLLAALHRAAVPGGVVVVSSPEPTSGKSGASEHNPDHKWELSSADFAALLNREFGNDKVELLSQRKVVLSTGAKTTCLYGVCHVES